MDFDFLPILRPDSFEAQNVLGRSTWPMSAGQRHIQQQYNSETKVKTEASKPNQPADSASESILEGRARAGALLVHVYQRGPQVDISPEKVLFEWTKELVSFCIPRSVLDVSKI